MLGLGVDRLRADMNRLLAMLFHQVLLSLLVHFHSHVIYCFKMYKTKDGVEPRENAAIFFWDKENLGFIEFLWK